MINGVLTERTVKEVVPILKTNSDGLKKALEELVKQYKTKQDEMEKWKVSLTPLPPACPVKGVRLGTCALKPEGLGGPQLRLVVGKAVLTVSPNRRRITSRSFSSLSSGEWWNGFAGKVASLLQATWVATLMNARWWTRSTEVRLVNAMRA